MRYLLIIAGIVAAGIAGAADYVPDPETARPSVPVYTQTVATSMI
jgi:hypothetical protein